MFYATSFYLMRKGLIYSALYGVICGVIRQLLRADNCGGFVAMGKLLIYGKQTTYNFNFFKYFGQIV